MRVVDLFGIASKPVLKVLTITALGSYLAVDNVNLLGVEARNQINRLVFYVFNPAIVGSNLARTITFESIVLLWFMPINILVSFIIGSALGWILIKITRPPKHLKSLVLGCCAGGNMGNLPLIIVPAICQEKGTPFGPPDVCHSFGIAYASLSMAIGAIYLWCYVYNMMRISAKQINQEEDDHNKLINSLSNSDLTYDLLHTPEGDSYTFLKNFSWKSVAEKLNLKSILAPSTTGAIVGFIVGAVPPIRKLFIGSSAPLHVVEDSASLVGDAAIPVVTLIVGANLLKGLKGSGGIGLPIILGIVAVRYVFLPLAGILTVKGAVRFGFVGSDPLYQFILLLQFAVPPAMNIGTMTQLFGSGQSECSVIMLWTYSVASISLTLWSTLFLWMLT